MGLCGAVKSCQEKGYVVDLGIGGEDAVEGFLDYKSAGHTVRFPCLISPADVFRVLVLCWFFSRFLLR
jgi:hypothetical protein